MSPRDEGVSPPRPRFGGDKRRLESGLITRFSLPNTLLSPVSPAFVGIPSPQEAKHFAWGGVGVPQEKHLRVVEG